MGSGYCLAFAALLLAILLLFASCAQSPPPSTPMQEVFNKTFALVTRTELLGGIYVQVTFRTFAFELAGLYSEAERLGWNKTQLEDKIKETIEYFATCDYPMEEELGLRNLYQIYITLCPSFDMNDPLQKLQFDNFRKNYIRRILGRVYQEDVLRNHYAEKWGYAKYDRLDFSVNLENRGVKPLPIADIGARTFLVDEKGNRFSARGRFRPYPHDFDRPRNQTLEYSDNYRVFFVNRATDGSRIITQDTRFIKLVIQDLGGEAEREFRWDLPFEYPKIALKPAERF